MTHHYVYRITNTVENRHYYGVRSSFLEPHNDLGLIYFSSSRDLFFMREQKLNPYIFKYKVVGIFENRIDALKLEIKLHKKFDVRNNPSFYNKVNQISVSQCTQGIKIPYKKKTPEQIEKHRNTRRMNRLENCLYK